MKITPAEFAVIDLLWREAPLPAAAIHERLCARKGWTATTVKTLLSRLVDKGAVAHARDGRRYLYEPVLTRGDYERSAARSLADRLFDGRAAPFVAHLADARGLTPSDVEEIEAILAELKRGRE